MQASPQQEKLFVEIEDLRRQILDIKADAQSLFASLNHEQFNWRPQAGVWSIAECIEHLNVAAKLYFPLLDAKINQGRANKIFGQEPFRYGWFNNWFVRTLEPPVKLKVKTPKAFAPTADKSFAAVTEEFMQTQEAVIERLYQANGLDLRRLKIQSPRSRLIKLRLGKAFAMIAAHERRHLWQARQLIAHPNFPAQ
ncbi:MAG: DinB family protein [Acidobacteriota bacterium]